MELIACGVSFHTASLDVREHAAIGEARARSTLRFLVGHSGLREAAVLSTCNRTEFYLVAPRPGTAGEVADRLARYLDPGDAAALGDHLVTRTGAEALAHMCRVAAGLDSMVLGEAQILGQMKDAHRVARDAGTVGHTLDFALKRAVGAGKRVRTETALGRGVASVGELALRWARDALGGVEGHAVLCIGAGRIGGQVARRLARAGAGLHLSSRTRESAQALAEATGGVAIDLDRVDDVVAGVDLVVCSTASPVPVLAAQDVRRWQELRGHRPLAVLDLAVPRDVEPDAAMVGGVRLSDLDALGATTQVAVEGRRAHVPQAEAIVAREVAATMALLAERTTTAPTIAALVARAERLRAAEVSRTLGRLPALDPGARQAVDALTRSLVRKLLHAPITHLKEAGDDPATALTLRQAFDLDTPTPADGG